MVRLARSGDAAIPEIPALRLRRPDLRLKAGAQAGRPASSVRSFSRRLSLPFAFFRRSFSSIEVAHLDVADLVGVEVHLGHLGEDEV